MPQLGTPLVNVLPRQIMPPRNLGHRRSAHTDFAQDRPLLSIRPSTPPFRTSHDFLSHVIPTATDVVNDVNNDTGLVENPPLHKAVPTGRLPSTVISDGEDCLKRLKTALPPPAAHILDWFHVAMKLRPIEQTAAWLSRQAQSDAAADLAEKIASVKWRLWNGQPDRALELINHLFHDGELIERDNPVIRQLRYGLMNLRTYIGQNRNSIANYGARYRAGKRIASTSAEASVNNLVARRMVKKQQMRWSEQGANLLLQVRVALANGDLEDHLAYQPPVRPRQPIVSPFVPVPLFQNAA